MRSNQQNKRSRSRGSSNNSNNRKSSNPLSRSYESNGPDVRIRGNAATVAEKYMQLARDAHSSGDSVAAENYLQHAEHYNRIISAAQAQYQQQQQARSEQNQPSDNRSPSEDDDEANTPVSRFDSPTQSRPEDSQESRDSGNQAPAPRQGSRPEHKAEKVQENNPAAAPQADAKDSKDAGEAAASEPTVKPRAPRRPRRKPQTAESASEAKPGADPAGSPQPSVGELPSFVTGNGEVNAAE